MSKLSILLSLLFVGLLGCNSQEDDIEVSSAEISTNQSLKTTYRSLSFYQNLGEVNNLPFGYRPVMEGVWNYANCYLFQQDGDTTHYELYHFEDSDEAERQTSDACDRKFTQVNNMFICNAVGNECSFSINETGDVCIIVCN